MTEPTRASPELISAHVRLLRLTDRLLDTAEQLRDARDRLQTLLDRPATTSGDVVANGRGSNHAV